MSNFIDGSYGSAQSTELIAKVLAGRCEMRYTRATVGKGRIPDDRTPTTMTESAEYVMDAKISGVSNPVKGECQVTVQIKSDDVQEDFRATNVVLFAEDPDVGEIPYAYLCLENEPEWIGAASSSVGKLITFEIIVFVGGVDNVSISINSESIATIAEVEKLIKIHNLDVSAHDEKFKKHIAMTTDQELINSLINNTAKAGSLLLFSYIGHKNGNVTGESYNLYTGLNNCNLYSGCVIRVKLPHESVQQEIHPNYFQHPSFYLAKIDESNAKQVTIYPLGGNTVEIIDNLTSDDVDKALSAAQGKWLNENKLGKREKAADSSKLDGHFSNYFATAAAVQTAQRAANQGINAAATAQTAATQGINAAAAAHGRANEAYSRAEQAFTSASNGKIKIANAITGKGIPTSTTASWQEMAGNIGKIQSLKMLRSKDYVKDDFRCISYYYKNDMNDYKTLKQKTELTNFKKEPFPIIDDTDTVLGCSFGSSSYEHYVDFLILRKPIDLTNVKTILVHAYPTFGSTSETYYYYYSAPNIVMACSLKKVADLTAMIPKSIEENSIIFYQQYKTSYDRYTRGRVFRTNKNIIGERYLVFSFAHSSGHGSFLFSHIELF